MSPELRLIVELLVVVAGGAVTLLARSVLGQIRTVVDELKRISAAVDEHGQALVRGNEKFAGLSRDLGELRGRIDDLERGRNRRRHR